MEDCSSGIVFGHNIEATVYQAQLVLRWMTICGSITLCYQSLSLNLASYPQWDSNEYRSTDLKCLCCSLTLDLTNLNRVILLRTGLIQFGEKNLAVDYFSRSLTSLLQIFFSLPPYLFTLLFNFVNISHDSYCVHV